MEGGWDGVDGGGGDEVEWGDLCGGFLCDVWVCGGGEEEVCGGGDMGGAAGRDGQVVRGGDGEIERFKLEVSGGF